MDFRHRCDHNEKLSSHDRKKNFHFVTINFFGTTRPFFFSGNLMETLGNFAKQNSAVDLDDTMDDDVSCEFEIEEATDVTPLSHEETHGNPCLSKKYGCQSCDYFTDRKSNLDHHFNSLRHHKETHGNPAKQKLSCDHVCPKCKKVYRSKAGLWKHNQSCITKNKDQLIPAVQNNLITTELVMELIKDNQEMKQIIMEQHNTINHLVKSGLGNTTTTVSNNNCMNNNQTFNLQFFLNETCKDAMNITDFVESIKVQLCDLERFGDVGYVEGLSNIITTNLKALDVTERPVHCTDKKRETIYIKDQNKWEKEDDNKSRLRKAIKKIASKNYRLLPAYREKYPGCQHADSKFSDKYNKMVVEAMGGGGDNESEKEDKIIRNISKVATIHKE